MVYMLLLDSAYSGEISFRHYVCKTIRHKFVITSSTAFVLDLLNLMLHIPISHRNIGKGARVSSIHAKPKLPNTMQ